MTKSRRREKERRERERALLSLNGEDQWRGGAGAEERGWEARGENNTRTREKTKELFMWRVIIYIRPLQFSQEDHFGADQIALAGTHTYVHVYAHTHTQTLTQALARTRTHAHTHTHTHTHAKAPARRYTSIHMNASMHTTRYICL